MFSSVPWHFSMPPFANQVLVSIIFMVQVEEWQTTAARRVSSSNCYDIGAWSTINNVTTNLELVLLNLHTPPGYSRGRSVAWARVRSSMNGLNKAYRNRHLHILYCFPCAGWWGFDDFWLRTSNQAKKALKNWTAADFSRSWKIYWGLLKDRKKLPWAKFLVKV